MAGRRRRSISAKVTDAEYARLVAQAGDRTISEWLRTIALEAVARPRLELLVLDVRADLRALRTILLNLQYATNRGERLTADAMQELINRADHDKVSYADKPATSTTPRRES